MFSRTGTLKWVRKYFTAMMSRPKQPSASTLLMHWIKFYGYCTQWCRLWRKNYGWRYRIQANQLWRRAIRWQTLPLKMLTLPVQWMRSLRSSAAFAVFVKRPALRLRPKSILSLNWRILLWSQSLNRTLTLSIASSIVKPSRLEPMWPSLKWRAVRWSQAPPFSYRSMN